MVIFKNNRNGEIYISESFEYEDYPNLNLISPIIICPDMIIYYKEMSVDSNYLDRLDNFDITVDNKNVFCDFGGKHSWTWNFLIFKCSYGFAFLNLKRGIITPNSLSIKELCEIESRSEKYLDHTIQLKVKS